MRRHLSSARVQPPPAGQAKRIPLTKYGLGIDPTGLHVSLPWRGRELLGTVTGWFVNITGARALRVRHFNGEPWPIEPIAAVVDVLEGQIP